jgi:hypothetical protein
MCVYNALCPFQQQSMNEWLCLLLFDMNKHPFHVRAHTKLTINVMILCTTYAASHTGPYNINSYFCKQHAIFYGNKF